MNTEDLKYNLTVQLDEIEVLQSMFTGSSGEKVILDDKIPLSQAEFYLSNHILNYDSCISFIIYLEIDLITNDRELCTLSSVFKIYFNFPREYPLFCLPRIKVVCEKASNKAQLVFDNELIKYTNNLTFGQQCTIELVQWVQENASKYLSPNESNSNFSTSSTLKTKEKPAFSRIWIYSHHIYSMEKRKNILSWAAELQLTGFSLPGKPGVICAEGLNSLVNEFHSRLKALNWKRITCKGSETTQLTDRNAETIQKYRKFETFSEINFDPHGNKDYHMDLGLFYTFLKNHGLEDNFKILFGIEGRDTANKKK